MKFFHYLFLLLCLLGGFSAAAKSGGDSAGGGDWLASQFFAAAQSMVGSAELTQDRLHFSTEEYLKLLDGLELVISDKPLVLGDTSPSIINFFPQKKIVIYRDYWEKLFRSRRNAGGSIFHELERYFLGNSLEYRIARAKQFAETPPFIFANARDGDYRFSTATEQSCRVHLSFLNGQRSVVMVSQWNSCSFVSLVFQCEDEEIKDCVAQQSYQADGSIIATWLTLESESSGSWGKTKRASNEGTSWRLEKIIP